MRAAPLSPVVGQSDFARLSRLTTLMLLRVVLDGLRIGPLRLVRVHGRGVACSSNYVLTPKAGDGDAHDLVFTRLQVLCVRAP